MKKVAEPEPNPAQEEEKEDKVFRETFRPKQSQVNFGTLKDEKRGPEKKKSKGKGLLVALILILLLAGAGTALYLTGYLTPVLDMVGLSQPAESVDSQALDERSAALDSREQSLDKREQSLNEREQQLDQQEAQLSTTQEESTDATSVSRKTFREMLAGLSDDELSDLKRVSSIYNKMDPAEAATILVGMYDLTQISAILYYMQPEASAQVLEQMEAATAANVTELILN